MEDRKLNIMYDYQMIVLQRFGGISRYIYDLATSFSKNHQVITPVLFFKSFYFESYFGKKANKFALWRWNKPIVFSLNKMINILTLITKKPDILHITYYNSYILPFIPAKTKLVVTAHDMIHEIYPELFPKWDFTSKHKRKVFKKADLIIAISENTKRDLIRFFGIERSKITVIYHGNPFEKRLQDVPLNIKKPYFLFIGQRDRYKNFSTLVQAIAPVLNEKSFYLVCVGGKPFSQAEMDLFASLKIQFMVEQKNCTEAELQSAYREAICLIYPSEYEGFGIPILEAWSMNCPLILSKASCFPEIAKDGALYFDPQNALELRDRIYQIIENPSTRELLINKGEKLLESYSLSQTAQKTMEAYCQTLTSLQNAKL